jgi:serine O-acetyltransferase
MINSIKELNEYYKIELLYHSKLRFIYDILFATVGGYIIHLRLLEYLQSKKSSLLKPFIFFTHWRLSRISVITGIHIPPGVCGKGLTLRHFGSIVVNSSTKIGRNCCIHNNVNIGTNKGGKIGPKIGNNVYIGPGAVLFGEIEIADGCYIGANAVINKSVIEPYSVILGIPGKVVKKDTKCWWEYNGMQRKK